MSIHNPDDIYLGDLAFGVIRRAGLDAAAGSPTAGAWLLSEDANAWADIAKLDEDLLPRLASMALERLYDGRT